MLQEPYAQAKFQINKNNFTRVLKGHIAVVNCNLKYKANI